MWCSTLGSSLDDSWTCWGTIGAGDPRDLGVLIPSDNGLPGSGPGGSRNAGDPGRNDVVERTGDRPSLKEDGPATGADEGVCGLLGAGYCGSVILQ